MKTLAINNTNFNTLIPEKSVKNPDYIWTSAPNKVNLINVSNSANSIKMDISMDGLSENNFSVKIAGNIIAIVLERKKELTKKSSWGNFSLNGDNEKYHYSIFERSDIFLYGTEIKILKSVKYDQGILKIIVLKKSFE
jgi:HSP20 family molecular chaperone IbpA